MRLVAPFLIRFLVVYGLLMAPWPGVREAYADAFRAVGNFVFWSNGYANFRPIEQSPKDVDTTMAVRHKRIQEWVQLDICTHHAGYLPTGICVALIVATPIPWRRRGWALLWGLCLLTFFISLRVIVMLVHGSYMNTTGDQGILGKAIDRAVLFFGVGGGVSYAASILIWVFVSFRQSDWPTFLDKSSQRRPAVKAMHSTRPSPSVRGRVAGPDTTAPR